MTKFQKEGKTNSTNLSQIKCYECDQYRHMKKDCPKLNNDKKKSKFEKLKKKKTFKVTWDDSESSSSESDSDSDGEQANVCFMAQKDEVPKMKNKEKWILDSGCSKHMTGNSKMLSNITSVSYTHLTLPTTPYV